MDTLIGRAELCSLSHKSTRENSMVEIPGNGFVGIVEFIVTKNQQFGQTQPKSSTLHHVLQSLGRRRTCGHGECSPSNRHTQQCRWRIDFRFSNVICFYAWGLSLPRFPVKVLVLPFVVRTFSRVCRVAVGGFRFLLNWLQTTAMYVVQCARSL